MMDIIDIYIGCEQTLEEQINAIYAYCEEVYPDSVLLSGLGGLVENVADYRRIPSIDAITDKLIENFWTIDSTEEFAGELHRWLLEEK